MCIRERFYKIDNQWCVVHLPEKPSGYAILLLGDSNNYVEEDSCYWLSHEGKRSVLEKLREAGYTIICSNLYGKHWGNKEAINLAKQCYHYLKKTEIVNPNIHIIAEGIGTLVALELLSEFPDCVRSLVLIDPIVSIKEAYQNEKVTKLFLKKFQKELQIAHKLNNKIDNNFHDFISTIESNTFQEEIPTKIYCDSHNIKLRQLFKHIESDYNNISLAFYLKEAKYQTLKNMLSFFETYEKVI